MIRALLLCLLLAVPGALWPAESVAPTAAPALSAPAVAPRHPAANIAENMPAAAADVPRDLAAADAWVADGGFWAKVSGGALVLLGLGLKFGKNLPGIAGIASSVAETAWRTFAPKSKQDADDHAERGLAIAAEFVDVFEEFKMTHGPDTVEGKLVRDMQEKLNKRLPSATRDSLIKLVTGA